MDDWSTISALATGGGTLVLAIATFVSVRSAHRTARAAERSLLAGIRPFLVPSRPQDPPEKVTFADDRSIHVEGGTGAAEITDEVIYLAIALKNAGSGMALLDRWHFDPEAVVDPTKRHDDVSSFRRLTRDLYLPAGELGFWQGAVRDDDDPQWKDLSAAITERARISLDLLYSDLEGGQRAISRFVLRPVPDSDRWVATVVRHWYLDQPSPR